MKIRVAESKKQDKDITEEYKERISQRDLGKSFWGRITTLAAITLSLFHLYTAANGILPVIQQRTFHLGFVMFMIFLLMPAIKNSNYEKVAKLDILLAFLALGCCYYIFSNYTIIALRGGRLNTMDIVVGAVFLLLILEGSRRAVGKELTSLMCIAILYIYFGKYAPGFLKHNGASVFRIIEVMAWTTEGPLGITLGVSSTFIFMFVLFGSILKMTGVADVIYELALGIAGHHRGGPAKVAVLASGMMGTISGSAVANVATTGTFTIPLMRKTGYSPAFAAAVEALASTGGQIMPPVMGAAAFIIAEYLGISYISVLTAAIIPAILYYVAAWTTIELEAIRLGLKGVDKKETPSVIKILKKRGHLLIPLVLLVYLLVRGLTPLYAAFYAIVASIGLTFIKKETRLTIKEFIDALENGAKGALSVAIACAVVGFMVGMTGMTGLGLVLADKIVKLAAGNLLFTMFLTMIVSIILGMGLPPTACYIVLATIAAPALTKLGVNPLAAHMFVFYFGMLSVITPPVAMASFTAAGIAGEKPSKVGWLGAKIAIAGFIIPYIFVSSPALLMINSSLYEIFIAVCTALVGVMSLASAAHGYLITKIKAYNRIILIASAFCLMHGGINTDIIGLVLLLIATCCQYYVYKKEKKLWTETH
jgi:TRAP transporter 4TM/12TM fusion protein